MDKFTQVIYHAGDFDITCNPKDAPAIVMGDGEDLIVGEKTVKTVNLIVFQLTDNPLLVSRLNVPNVADKLTGADGKESHASWS